MNRRAIIFNTVIAMALFLAAATQAAPPAQEEIIPLIEMNDTPLSEAIRQLASKARLNILLDPRLSAPPFDRMTVTIRWQDVTAPEALNALLDNYGLVLVESPRSSSALKGAMCGNGVRK